MALTKTFAAKAKNVNRIDCTIYYSKGGDNPFFYTKEKRGYYFSINPYEVEDHDGVLTRKIVVSPTKGTRGWKECIIPVTRATKKRYEQAKGRIDELIDAYLVDFCIERGIELGELIETVESK